MSILSGFLKTKKYRLLDTGDYKLQSEWTSAQTTYMDDNETTVQETITEISDTLKPLIQDITEIKLVETLPEDAADHPTTLYLTTKN